MRKDYPHLPDEQRIVSLRDAMLDALEKQTERITGSKPTLIEVGLTVDGGIGGIPCERIHLGEGLVQERHMPFCYISADGFFYLNEEDAKELWPIGITVMTNGQHSIANRLRKNISGTTRGFYLKQVEPSLVKAVVRCMAIKQEKGEREAALAAQGDA